MKRNEIQATPPATAGFTLVEMMIVLVVVGLLSAMAVPGINSWIDYGIMRRQNDQARMIYMAAQTRLTQYEEQGRLTAFTEMMTCPDSQPAAPENTYKVPGDSDGGCFYLKAKKGDYEQYQLLTVLPPEAIRELPYDQQQLIALFDLIDPQITDKSILSHAGICIELDPDPRTALVYSVFYMDYNQHDEFTYNETAGINQVSVTAWDFGSVKEKRFGYYGSDIK
ncbi:MAG: pilus assembly FimT family protein [Lachnospiraceae bacterium]